MSASSSGNRDIERILVVRLSAMGDVIHTLPAVQVLRDAFPNAQLGWLIEDRWAELLSAPGTPLRGQRSQQRPLVDWVHVVNLKGWRRSLPSMATVEQIVRVWNDVRSMKYQVAVDLQGAIRSAILARWSGAPVIYGSALPRESPASLWYTRQGISGRQHVIEQYVSLVSDITGHDSQIPRAAFPREPQAEERMDQQLRARGLSEFAILNPGAGWGAKRWPAERYGRVAAALAKNGTRSIVNYGPGEEDLAREVEWASEGAATALRTSISELIALTRRAKLFIGGDTGPMHLAAALRVPVVAIYGPTDPARNGPYGTRSVVLRNPASATSHARNARPDEGMLGIDSSVVAEAGRSLLAERKTEPTHG